MTTMLTWQADDGHGFEGTRLHFGTGHGFRALGRLVRADPEGEFTASYRLVVREDGTVERVSLTSATATRERHLTINRTEDGYWLLDTGSGGTRAEFDGAVDVDLAGSPMFNSLPVRRLGLHTEPGEHTIPVVYVSLPDLEVTLVQQTYRTVSAGDDPVVEFSSDGVSAELTLDADGVVVAYPGLATRYAPAPAVG
ncbi:MAG: uncharacterized protein QOG20_2164 [Pseudonocardiales bacterium]|jgi:hypothetical protein|uniref:putative glycolipid-binding domain-containing protein n=1 Tax=Pseudonocardia sp. TaxID=60912 RepID=UPI00263310FD|nr:putative glycolipid-binding domain-containing protein [Pseudonocardia sp.]MCW2718922.1 hypothetical protein [Pseudonocardia sp.]MDT7614729.1 uncharacterized protein [Pseudonocardiales bacterium]MDT7706557.1 uncharacterized protein [Pseudonocardiales bacterium]